MPRKFTMGCRTAVYDYTSSSKTESRSAPETIEISDDEEDPKQNTRPIGSKYSAMKISWISEDEDEDEDEDLPPLIAEKVDLTKNTRVVSNTNGSFGISNASSGNSHTMSDLGIQGTSLKYGTSSSAPVDRVKNRKQFNWKKKWQESKNNKKAENYESVDRRGRWNLLKTESNVDELSQEASCSSSNEPSTGVWSEEFPSKESGDPVIKKEKVQHHEILIAGAKVKFPVEPYRCQKAVMNKLIQGITKEQNCLLESPTGSGKTLALLCGSLAWQEKQNDERNKQFEELHPSKFPNGYAIDVTTSDEEESFHPSKKLCATKEQSLIGEKEEVENRPDDKNTLIRVPKIYYGTRTHKQIQQVVRELGKTAYANKRMTILSSRSFTCIQDTKKDKTELCNSLLDGEKGKGCPYYNDSNKKKIATHLAISSLGLSSTWDIEDLVSLGRKESCCPYFAARALMAEAEIIFCPYNYIIDPAIRESMQLELRNEIIILDEAHNIEDICRSVASVNIHEDQLDAVAEECSIIQKKRPHDFATYSAITNYFQSLIKFLKITKLTSDDDRNGMSSDRWTGKELMELLEIHGLGRTKTATLLAAAAAATLDFNQAKEDIRMRKNIPLATVSQMSIRFLEQVTFAFEKITSDKYADDYRACIVETEVRDITYLPNDRWVSKDQKSTRQRCLQMMCMSPAVVFAPLAGMARSVILASGTLAPTKSFQTELGTAFPNILDAPHVVPKDQVYVRGIPCGPTNFVLKATYDQVNTFGFQDELGRLVQQVCNVIPHGVLCFFASYAMMKKQTDRWIKNGTWDRLCAIKNVFKEPPSNVLLDQVMKEYRDVIRETIDGPKSDGVNGALLFAVIRGKVAEGIDFSDEEARCVMTVGIPYAVRADPVVALKWTYNDLNQSRGLLRGSEWYKVQAFRALNQALGRCVRHRNDWGAVLLIDQRFLNRLDYSYLPKWIREMWRDSPEYNLTRELEEFVTIQTQKKNEKMSIDE